MDSASRPARPLTLRRRFKRWLVRIRTSQALIPTLLVLFYLGIMVGLAQVADSWIVGLAAMPLFFAVVLTMGCLLAYLRDFYA
ncbi:hypothetical protein PMIT1342_01837 [Prochlorococcus marinus str. MIT 1342]|uniref:hypothetical protein n=1 Tax=Prochlorococcus TaxID=1218 RepID=UPI0007B367E7|nr:hypothetical protein [Prochlorococcus marinus]KZR79892.1 hypothetical protein PMIT1342_01837 [Prochlorococcus marinus str. MIT 1342]